MLEVGGKVIFGNANGLFQIGYAFDYNFRFKKYNPQIAGIQTNLVGAHLG